MLKLLLQGKDGEKDTITLGLEEGNIRELKKDHPIAFPVAEVGLNDPRFILITYNGPDWQKNKESLKQNPGLGFCFVLGDETLEKLKSGQDAIVETPDYNFVLVYGTDNEALCERFKGGIGPKTTVVRTGFAPGDAPNYFSSN